MHSIEKDVGFKCDWSFRSLFEIGRDPFDLSPIDHQPLRLNSGKPLVTGCCESIGPW